MSVQEWYLAREGQRYGPYTWQELTGYARQGAIGTEDLVWSVSTGDWLPADQVPNLLPVYFEAPAKSARRPKLKPWLFAVVLVPLLVIAAVFLLRDRLFHPEPERAFVNQERSEASQPYGKTLTLQGGGVLLIPEGAFPANAQVTAELSDVPPLLPDDLQPVGSAVRITADAQPDSPLYLRLPVPPGDIDPQELVVLRVETDGNTTALMTWLEQDHLVAATPGLSLFILSRVPWESAAALSGKALLLPGEKATYRASIGTPNEPRNAVWTVSGDARIVHENEMGLTIQAGQEEGPITISYTCYSMANALRWYGLQTITVTEQSPDLDQGFMVTAVTSSPTTRPESTVHISATAYGEFVGPITWVWDYGDGEVGGPVTTGPLATSFALPGHAYRSESPRRFGVTVTATDDRGMQAQYTLPISVEPSPLHPVLSGPDRLDWQTGGVSATYQALVWLGKPPYAFDLGLLPAQRKERLMGERADFTVFFDEPGGHMLALTVTDQQRLEGAVLCPVHVAGGDALTAEIIYLPEEAQTGAEVTATVQIRGGVLVVNGKKSGYRIKLDWGDGSEPLIKEGVGADRRSTEGTELTLAHTYEESDTYVVRLEVYDGVSNHERDARQIDVAPPTARVYGVATLSGTLDNLVSINDSNPVANVTWYWGRSAEADSPWRGCYPVPLVNQLDVQFEADLDNRTVSGVWSGAGIEQPSRLTCMGAASCWFEGELEEGVLGLDDNLDGGEQPFHFEGKGWTVISCDADMDYQGAGVARGVEASRQDAITMTLPTTVVCEWDDGVGNLRIHASDARSDATLVVYIPIKDPPFEIVR